MDAIAEVKEERKPFWAKCGECFHIWTCAYLPMNMSAMAEIFKRVRCPNCATNKVFVAKQHDGKLKEVIDTALREAK